MRYLGTSGAALAAAMMFSLAPLGRTAQASENKPVVRSILERNTILPPSASSSTTVPLDVQRYMNPPTLLEGLVYIDPTTCTEISEGAWTYTPDQLCGKDASGNVLNCGTITTGTVTSTPGSGVCAGSTLLQSIMSGPLITIKAP
jgi:hypothetical protein